MVGGWGEMKQPSSDPHPCCGPTTLAAPGAGPGMLDGLCQRTTDIPPHPSTRPGDEQGRHCSLSTAVGWDQTLRVHQSVALWGVGLRHSPSSGKQ